VDKLRTLIEDLLAEQHDHELGGIIARSENTNMSGTQRNRATPISLAPPVKPGRPPMDDPDEAARDSHGDALVRVRDRWPGSGWPRPSDPSGARSR
jgi:hypothetical protein